MTLALLTCTHRPGQFCRFIPCTSSSSIQEHMQSALLKREVKLMKWPQTWCWDLVDCWGSGLLPARYRHLPRTAFIGAKVTQWACDTGLMGKLEVKWNQIMFLRFIFTSGHALCTLHSLLDFTEAICLDRVRNIDDSTSKINTELVWGSSQ